MIETMTAAILTGWKNTQPMFQAGPYRVIGVDEDYLRIIGPGAPARLFAKNRESDARLLCIDLARSYQEGYDARR